MFVLLDLSVMQQIWLHIRGLIVAIRLCED